jgi:hypothetical protein
MRSLTMAAALATAAVCISTLPATRADAAAFGPASGLALAANAVDVTENVQYYYGGRRHCWYPDGWHGPGWYWCGYRLRQGYGWGGPEGWHGWSYGPPPPRRPPPPPMYRRPPPPPPHRPPPPRW